MQKYKVVIIAVSGKAGRVYHSGETVTQAHLVDEVETMVKEGRLEPIVDEVETPKKATTTAKKK